jgi:hypothetical protein
VAKAADTLTHEHRTIGVAGLAVLMLLASATSAGAEWFITPFLGIKFAGDTNFPDLEQGAGSTKLTLGAAAGVVGEGLFGVETELGYSPRFFERSNGSLIARSNVLTLMGNVIITAPRSLTGYSLRPFVSGGGGLIHVGIQDVADILSVSENLFGINVGGGAVGVLTPRTSVRFDLRFLKSVTNGDAENVVVAGPGISFWRATVGLAIR